MISTSDTLARGARMPHTRVTTLDGTAFNYDDVWQRRNLLLVALPSGQPTAGDAAWLETVESARHALEAYEAVVVVTQDSVPGLAPPGVVVADRWGEVAFAETAQRTSDLPSPDTLDAWLKFVDHACPECEGEWR